MSKWRNLIYKTGSLNMAYFKKVFFARGFWHLFIYFVVLKHFFAYYIKRIKGSAVALLHFKKLIY